jgi:hypothetical protein
MHPPSTGLPESMENYSGGALTPPVMSSKKKNLYPQMTKYPVKACKSYIYD